MFIIVFVFGGGILVGTFLPIYCVLIYFGILIGVGTFIYKYMENKEKKRREENCPLNKK